MEKILGQGFSGRHMGGKGGLAPLPNPVYLPGLVLLLAPPNVDKGQIFLSMNLSKFSKKMFFKS